MGMTPLLHNLLVSAFLNIKTDQNWFQSDFSLCAVVSVTVVIHKLGNYI